jgi:hypothetical protein
MGTQPPRGGTAQAREGELTTTTERLVEEMLRGLRTAIKYFTIGLLAGLLLAPRKGEDTRKLLVERGKEYLQEAMDMSGGRA